jgi:hypothetical protein
MMTAIFIDKDINIALKEAHIILQAIKDDI